MSTPEREAADQLVRLTRMIIRMEEHRELEKPPPRRRSAGRRRPAGPAGPAGPRRLRHNQAELTEREQQVLGLLVQGTYNEDLARELQISVRAVEHHLEALCRCFGRDVETAPTPGRSAGRRTVTAILIPVTGTLAVSGAVVGMVMKADEPMQDPAGAQTRPPTATPAVKETVDLERARRDRADRAVRTKRDLPRGVSTATSFWDPVTATGQPMSFRTLASPYWPLGTKVKIRYRGRTAVGVVEDFGPAEWAVAQHQVPAIIDISERMMMHLTGTRVNRILVRFEVLSWGKGAAYRDSGTGYGLATGQDT